MNNIRKSLKKTKEIEGLPLMIPRQNAFLIGSIVDNSSKMNGMAAYYIHWRGSLLIGNYSENYNTFNIKYTTNIKDRIMSHQVKAFDDMEVESELSTIGKTLLKAYKMEKEQNLSTEKAHRKALKEEFTQEQLNEILNTG